MADQIVVVDLGTGNLRSVAKAVAHVAPMREVVVSHEPGVIAAAERLVLPGQGAIGTWMKQMDEAHMRDALNEVIATRPVLGICVGMQALFDRSEEDGGTDALGVIPGEVRRFPGGKNADGENLTIPQMGWNRIMRIKPHPVWRGVSEGERFYFANSYCAHAANHEDVVGECEYGVTFAAAVAKGKLFAVQFHPEKSQRAGLKLMENFVAWQP